MSRWIRRYPKTALLFVILIVCLLLAGWRWGFASAPAIQWKTATVERGDVEELVHDPKGTASRGSGPQP